MEFASGKAAGYSADIWPAGARICGRGFWWMRTCIRSVRCGSSKPKRSSQPQAETRPALQPVADGTPFARLQIDRLNMNLMVIEGVTDDDLRKAVGHIPYTALPGNPGNVGLAGHRDTFFRPLRNIQVGDVISLTTSQGTHVYQVENTEIVKPEDSGMLRPTAQPTLTLVTCFPFYYVGSAPNRLIVQAVELQQKAPLDSSGADVKASDTTVAR